MLTAVGTVLQAMIPGIDVEIGQANLVPEPQVADFIVLTKSGRARQATNVQTWGEPAPTTLDRSMSTAVTYQADIHGPNSADNAQVVAELWRDSFTCDALTGAGLRPLHATDPQQAPFINGSNQYEDRWVTNLVLQANVEISTAQQFAATLEAGLIEVDTKFPP